MVKKILRLLHQEYGGLHKAALILALSSLTSGFLGLLRDHLLAGTFGAGRELDIYYAAFKIPDFLYSISLALVSITVLIPFFIEKNKVSQEKAKEFLGNTFSLFLFMFIVLAGVAFFVAPYLVKVVTPGFSGDAQRELILITRILLISPLLLGISNLLSSVVQSFRRFFIYALSPVLYNVGIILGIIFLSPRFGLVGLAVGVVIGALLHLLVQVPSIIRLGFAPIPRLKINFREGWKVVRLSLPRAFGLSLYQLVSIYITATASFLVAGSISVYNLASNLNAVPIAIIGLSYSVAAFPTLARFFVNEEKEKFFNHVLAAMRQILFWAVPVSVAVIVLRAQIVRVILDYGEFGRRGTRLTAAALALFAVSLVAQALILLFVRAFYAAGKTAKPIIVNSIFSVFIISLIFVLTKMKGFLPPMMHFIESVLRVKGVLGSDVLILPFAYSLGVLLNAIFLIIVFQKDFGGIWTSIKKTFWQVVSASFLMGLVIYLCLNFFDNIFDIQTFVGILLQGLASGFAGGITWFAVLSGMKSNELEEITRSFKQKFWKERPVAPEPQDLESTY